VVRPLTAGERRALIAVLVLAFVLRAAWALYAARPPVGLHDPSFYLVYGERIADGFGYTLPSGEPTAYYPVGYPAFLAGVFWLFGWTGLPGHDLAAWANVGLGVATVALAFALGRRLFDVRTGLVAAGVVGVLPNLVLHTAVALTETLFIALVLAAVLVLVSADEPSRGRLLAFGLLTGLSAEVRPVSLLFLPAVAVVWLACRRGWRRSAVDVAVASAAVAVVLVPWTLRNADVMGSPIVLGANVGDNLCIGNHPDATGAFLLSDYCSGGYDDLPRPAYETERNAEATEKGLRYLREHPGAQPRLLWNRVLFTVEHDHDALDAVESYGADPWLPSGLRRALAWLADWAFYAVAVLAVISMPRFLRRERPDRLAVLLCGLALAAAPLPFFGDPRFKVPVLPFLALGAAAVLASGRGRAAPTSSRGAAPPRRSRASSSTGPGPGR
jgi:4-amino-4-deoxy-L-arabinose transferase-like glycosyltransferase